MTFIKFNMHRNLDVPLEERIDIMKQAEKHTPRTQQIGDGEEMKKPILRCLHCNQPVFQVGEDKWGPVVSCATEGCEGNQDTIIDPYYISVKKHMIGSHPELINNRWALG